MNVRAAKAGLAIQEIPSYEHLRLHGMSNLNVVRDGMRIAKFILRERFPGPLGKRVAAYGPVGRAVNRAWSSLSHPPNRRPAAATSSACSSSLIW